MNRPTATSRNAARLRQDRRHGSESASLPNATESLADRIRQALCSSGYGALNSVEISVDSGHVTLRGPVRSFYEKQIATSIVLPLDGVTQLSNELAVPR